MSRPGNSAGDFDGKVVLVTGGSGGIGRTVCRRFAERGARVWAHFNSREEAAVETLEGLAGGPHATVRCDLREAASVKAMVDRVAAEAGSIDVLVNNAGVFERHPPLAVGWEEWCDVWDRTLATNLTGAAHASYCACALSAALSSADTLARSGRTRSSMWEYL